MSEALLVEDRGSVMWLTINRPEARNALNREVTDGLVTAIQRAGQDPNIRVVVLTGAGDRTFCAGADLKESASGGKDSTFSSGGGENPLVRVYRAMRGCHKPIIGRINGSALGGGLGLVSACDLVYSADHAQFGTPEVKVGVFPMMITTYLIRQLPRRRFVEMAFLAEPLSAKEAEGYDLINEALPAEELDSKVHTVIAKLLMNCPTALRMGKKALDVMQDMSIDQTLVYAELMIEKLAATDDAKEGMAAFAEKRRPAWAVIKEV